MSKKVNKEIKNIIEAALMIANQPVSIDRLIALFPEGASPTREEIRKILDVLMDDYKGRGIELKKIDKSYRLQSKTEYSEWLSRLTEEKPPRYSRAALETLAIIAYRQPVTRGDIEDIRGVTVSTDIIRNLVDREWIRQVGSRDVPGKPSLYGTTKVFLEYFNLSGLGELPSLSELRDLEEIGKELNLSLNLEQATRNTDTGKTEEVNGQAQDESPVKMLSPDQDLAEDEIVQPVEAKVGQLNQ